MFSGIYRSSCRQRVRHQLRAFPRRKAWHERSNVQCQSWLLALTLHWYILVLVPLLNSNGIFSLIGSRQAGHSSIGRHWQKQTWEIAVVSRCFMFVLSAKVCRESADFFAWAGLCLTMFDLIFACFKSGWLDLTWLTMRGCCFRRFVSRTAKFTSSPEPCVTNAAKGKNSLHCGNWKANGQNTRTRNIKTGQDFVR